MYLTIDFIFVIVLKYHYIKFSNTDKESLQCEGRRSKFNHSAGMRGVENVLFT